MVFGARHAPRTRPARRRAPRAAGALSGSAVLCLAGCNGLFLGEDYAPEALPHRTVNAWPLVEREVDPASGATRTLGLGGLVVHHEEPAADATHSAAFPFYWHERVGDDATTCVPPLYWHASDGERSSTTLWPLFGRYEDGTRARTSVLSEAVSVGGDPAADAVDVSAPRGVVEYHRAGDDRSLSVLGYGRLALFAHEEAEDGTWTHAFPLLWHWASPGGGDAGGVTGDAAGEAASSSWLVAPLVYSSSQGDGARTVLGLPGVYYRRDGDAWTASWLGVLAHARGTPGEASGHVLGVGPVALAAWHREATSSRLHVAPLYWSSEDEASAASVVFPLWWRFEDKTDASTRTLLFPLLHVASRADTGRLDVLYPLFHSETEGPDRSHWGVLYHLVRYEQEEAERHDLRVLYKLFRHRRDGTRVETELTPVFTWSEDPAADFVAFSVLGVLYAYERHGQESEHRFLHFLRL